MSPRLIALFCLVIGLMTAVQAQFEIQRANLHIHTSSSWRGGTLLDGLGPADHWQCDPPYVTASKAATQGLDVVGFSDHGESLVPWEWSELDLAFSLPITTLRGFEWTGPDHINVFGSESWCGAGFNTGYLPIENGSPPNPNVTSVASLMSWLRQAPPRAGYGPRLVAQFNHVNLYSSFGGFSYDPASDPYFCLIEMGSSLGDYPNDFGDLYHHLIDSEDEFRVALSAGWHVAPSIGADNQVPPKSSDRKRHTAIYTAVGGGREAVMDGLRARRVFASESKDFQLDYRCRVEGQTGFPHWMGEQVFLPNGKSTTLWIVAQDLVQIDYLDVMTPFGQIRRYGSINDTYFATTLTLTPTQLRSYGVTANDEACVYLRIHFENGNDAISAPIWFKDRTYVSGTQPEDWVWTESRSPYIISGAFTIPAGRTLTIEPGVVVKSTNPNPMSMVVHGQVVVQGSSFAPVIFTSIDDHTVGGATGDGAPDTADWPGIALYGEGSTQFAHAEVRYASSGIEGKPNYWQGTITATDVVFRSNSNGILIQRWNEVNPASISLERCRFESSANMGLYVSGGGSSAPITASIVGCEFIESTGIGLALHNSTRPVVRDCQFEGNGNGFFVSQSELIGFDNLTFHDNDKVGSLASCSGDLSLRNTSGSQNALGVDFYQCWITTDTTLTASSAIPSYILAPQSNGHSLAVAFEKTLTIEPGVIIKGGRTNAPSFAVYGQLVVQGSPSASMIFTSVDDNTMGGATGDGAPDTGDWKGISLYGDASAHLDHTEVRYASTGIEGMANYWQGTIKATDCRFRTCYTGLRVDRWNAPNSAMLIVDRSSFDSGGAGINLTNAGSSGPISTDIRNSSFRLGTHGIAATGSSTSLHVQNSTFDRITYGASLNVSNSTWVHNSYSACGVAIKSYGGANQFMANVISRCDTGIENQSSYSIGYANVFFDNNSNYIGINPGKGDQYVDPRFVDVDNGDLHLRSDSPCIDLIPLEWISPAILEDIDHHKRPIGQGLEPGADEVTDAVIVLPNVLHVAPGRVESGGLSDLFEADESRLLLEAARVRGSNDDLILAIEGIAENPHPLDLRMLFTLAADVPGATYQVEFFNFESQNFEVVRSTPCPLSDTSFEAGVYVKAGRFVEPGTGRLNARLRFRLAGGAPKTGWHFRLDQAVWRLGQP